MTQQETININNKDYKLEDLDDHAKSQLISLRACEQEIGRLKIQMAIAETAKMAYTRALIEAVESEH
ncbi:MAG: hypothetical protein KQH63_20950 [Desulfobulbaceae bacterium]|nr:hypothetical protein [Desulfobulbaceae bacterium]